MEFDYTTILRKTSSEGGWAKATTNDFSLMLSKTNYFSGTQGLRIIYLVNSFTHTLPQFSIHVWVKHGLCERRYYPSITCSIIVDLAFQLNCFEQC